MNCPKCGSDKTNPPETMQTWWCSSCGLIWTDWQQQEIDRLMGLLREIELILDDIASGELGINIAIKQAIKAAAIAKRAREK